MTGEALSTPLFSRLNHRPGHLVAPPPHHSPLQRVSGVTDVSLFKGKASIVGRSSPLSLYSKHLSSMDAHGTWNPQDSTGFIRINAVRLKAHYLREANILSGAAKKTQLK